MTDEKLKNKAKLFMKLGGRLYEAASPFCSKCHLRPTCTYWSRQHEFPRKIFLRAKEGEHWKMCGFGQDFGMPPFSRKDGEQVNFVSVCVEWMDTDPLTR